MKLIAQRDDLSQALDKVELVLSSGIDLYRQILMEGGGKWAVFTGTNTTVTIKTALEVDAPDEDYKLLLPPEIARAVRSFDSGEVTLTQVGARLELRSEHGPRFRFGYGVADSYPKIEFRKRHDFVLSKEQLTKIILYLGAIRSDVVCLEGNQLMVTDNFRLGIIRLGLAHAVDKVLMPMSLFSQADRVLTANDDIEVIIEERRVTLRQGINAISALRVETKFPDLEKIISKLVVKGSLTAKKADLLSATARASVVASSLIPVHIELKSGKSEALVSASRTEVGDSNERMMGKWEGEDFQIQFNIDFFRSIIAVLGPEITMQFGESNEMFRISSEDDPMVLFVMMPVKKF